MCCPVHGDVRCLHNEGRLYRWPHFDIIIRSKIETEMLARSEFLFQGMRPPIRAVSNLRRSPAVTGRGGILRNH
jgi:hypothetical protein